VEIAGAAFAEEDAEGNAFGSGFQKEHFANRVQRPAAVEDVVEQNHVPAAQVGERLVNGDRAGAGRAGVGRGGNRLKLQGQVHAPQQIGHEDQSAVEDADDGERSAPVVAHDFAGHLIQPAEYGGLVVEDPGNIGVHRRSVCQPAVRCNPARVRSGIRGTPWRRLPCVSTPGFAWMFRTWVSTV
jgi:hypothetical protein